MRHIVYTSGYKYQLREDYMVKVNIRPGLSIVTEYIQLSLDGVLTIRKGYAWDGSSGPAIDSLNFMRGSLVHDALYQLIRKNYLSQRYRETADMELRDICREDGMSRLRAWWVYWGVRNGGGFAASSSSKRRLVYAPGSPEEGGQS